MKPVRVFLAAGIILCCMAAPCFSSDVTNRAFMACNAGTIFYIADDYMNGSLFDSSVKPRLYGDLGFGYILNPHLATSVAVGFGWQAYSFDDMRVATATPLTVGVEYRYTKGKYVPRAGIGVGYYIWSVLDDRRVMKDPVTREELKRGDPGGYLLAGLDYFVRPDVALTCDVTGHYILSEDTDAFPSGYGFDENLLVIKMGVRYYFSLQKKVL